MLRIAATLADFLKASLPTSSSLSRSEAAGVERLQDEQLLRPHTEGMLGLKCDSALSVNAEVSNCDRAAPCLRDTMSSQ
ncbi:hypothetical protein CesoFtcFv8_020682 [Champsocephalus esox]|uniref:Uncharacterized protein n=2 Tax=Champsocephalus TaxID=52236 RepID=A0AAN8CQN2_CHAGU|nr:hypothetical protein CesoFtcFv8_020682 [Champsocephalus esox]KAK5908132.1 hypothetical protein CgunFtcFv8_016214 [Champsocephalus gunnari]